VRLDHLALLESDLADLQEHPKGRVCITAPGYYADRHHMPTRVRLLIDFLVEKLRAMDEQ
jgi:hypothetical protein